MNFIHCIKELNEIFNSRFISIKLFSDGSGYAMDIKDDVVCEFDSHGCLESKIAELKRDKNKKGKRSDK